MLRFEEYSRSYQFIRMERRGGILQMTLHTDGGPLQWNLDAQVEFVRAFTEVGADRGNRVVILTGTGNEFSGPRLDPDTPFFHGARLTPAGVHEVFVNARKMGGADGARESAAARLAACGAAREKVRHAAALYTHGTHASAAKTARQGFAIFPFDGSAVDAGQGAAVRMAATLLALASGALVHAQDYPVKAVRIVVPFAPGGPNDLSVRPVAQKLYEFLGQPFVIDYRAGANGIIGSELVAKSPPDGYTLLIVSSSFTINASTYAKLPFDPLRDFAPVSSIATSDIILVVNPAVPARSVKEFVALAKSRPGKLNFSSSGAGGSLHLGAELFKLTAGIDMVHVPYKGASLALTDVIGGHVDSMFISAPGAIAQIKAGKVRVLAVASPRRAQALPDTPTFAEAGYPEVQVDTCYGILAPAATPSAIIARLQAAIVRALGTPEVRETYLALNLQPAPSSSQEYTAYLKDDVVRWRKVVAAARLTPI